MRMIITEALKQKNCYINLLSKRVGKLEDVCFCQQISFLLQNQGF